MRNPFIFGRPVTGADFINRKKELADFLKLLDSGNNIILVSRRQVGKTSLLLKLREILKKKGWRVVYLDLFLVKGLDEFLSYFLTEIARETQAPLQKIASWLTSAVSTIRPTFTVDETGAPNMSVDVRESRKQVPRMIQEIIDLPKDLRTFDGKPSRGVAVILDEFQRIYEIGGSDLESMLRAIMQRHKGINYLFAGSNRAMIQEAFANKSRPFYEWGVMRTIESLDPKEMQAWIRSCFSKERIEFGEGVLDHIFTLCDNVPNAIQMFFFHLWNIVDTPGKIGDDSIGRVIEQVHAANNSVYEGLIANLSEMQVRVLKGIARFGGSSITTSDFLSGSRLGNSAIAVKSAKSLLDKNVIEKDSDGFSIRDPFFRLWLRKVP